MLAVRNASMNSAQIWGQRRLLLKEEDEKEETEVVEEDISGESGQPCLVPDLSGNGFSF